VTERVATNAGAWLKPGTVPSGWAWTTLDEIADVRLGRQRSPKNHAGSRMRPYLRAANVTWRGLELSDVKEMNFTEAESETYELRPGDVLVAEASGSASEVGKPGIWRGEIEGCCFQNTLVRVRTQHASPEYLRYFLLLEARSGRIGNASPGVGIHHIGAGRLSEWPVLLPPLNEQRRIVAAIEEHLSRLDAADASLAAASRRLIPLRAHALAANGNGWPTSALRELLREPLRNGHSAKASRDGTVRTLTLTAVTRAQFTDDNTKLTAADSAKVKGLWLEPGDIFIERSNTPGLVGTAALFNGPREWAIFPDLLIRVRVGDAVLPAFLEIILKSRPARTYFQRSAQGIAGSMPKIDQGVVERLEVPVPPLEEQRRIVAEIEERLGAIDALRAAIERAQRRGAALRRSVLERAFRGELVPQDPSDEPAEALLARIRAERDAAKPAGRRKRA